MYVFVLLLLLIIYLFFSSSAVFSYSTCNQWTEIYWYFVQTIFMNSETSKVLYHQTSDIVKFYLILILPCWIILLNSLILPLKLSEKSFSIQTGNNQTMKIHNNKQNFTFIYLYFMWLQNIEVLTVFPMIFQHLRNN